MKKLIWLITIFLSLAIVVQATSMFNLESMSQKELVSLQNAITAELEKNHAANSAEQEKVLAVTKQAVESLFSQRNISISWAWVNYNYTKDWNFYTVSTHIDYKDLNGNKQKPSVYGEVYDVDGTFQLVYLMIGEEEVLNNRAAMPSDDRLALNVSQSSTDAKTQGKTNTKPSNDKPLPVVVTNAPIIKVKAGELIKAYDNNEVKADAAYKGKIISVSGKVISVRVSWGKPIVEIGTGEIFEWGITCYFDKEDQDLIATLDQGDTVKITGTCDGKSFMSVSLSDCSID